MPDLKHHIDIAFDPIVARLDRLVASREKMLNDAESWAAWNEAHGKGSKANLGKLQEIHAGLKTGHDQLKNDLAAQFPESKVTGRLKTLDSTLEKMERKGLTDISDLQDVSGTRIITSNAEDTQQAIDRFKSEYGDKVIPGSEDNYFASPKDTGYRAYHAAIESNGVHEVQIRTENMNHWAETYHVIYKNEPWVSGLRDNPEVKSYFKQAAEAFASRDEGKYVSLPSAPYQLKELGLAL
jgi:ppGpp synthetase/RelA/SpoT-type nucleotidyltranferase